MQSKSAKRKPFTLGMRAIKTLAATTLIAFCYALLDRNPCFACIGAVFAMGTQLKAGLKNGGNRLIGTIMGGIVAIPFYPLYTHETWGIPGFVYLTLGMAVILIIGQLLGAGGGIQPGAVVFYVVLLTVNESKFVVYILNRILDTGIGVAVALLINAVLPSPYEDGPHPIGRLMKKIKK